MSTVKKEKSFDYLQDVIINLLIDQGIRECQQQLLIYEFHLQFGMILKAQNSFAWKCSSIIMFVVLTSL